MLHPMHPSKSKKLQLCNAGNMISSSVTPEFSASSNGDAFPFIAHTPIPVLSKTLEKTHTLNRAGEDEGWRRSVDKPKPCALRRSSF